MKNDNQTDEFVNTSMEQPTDPETTPCDSHTEDDSLSEEELLRLFHELLASHDGQQEERSKGEENTGRDEDEEDEKEDDDEDLETDEDEDEEDDEDDDKDEGSDEDEEDTASDCSGKMVPLGKRVLLRRSFKSNEAYCQAVAKSIRACLASKYRNVELHTLRDGSLLFTFDVWIRNTDVSGYILIEQHICNYRIQLLIDGPMRDGRATLMDYFMTHRNYWLRYGKMIIDHDDNDRSIEHSVCFYDAFAQAAFERYLSSMISTFRNYQEDLDQIANQSLSADQKKQLRTCLLDIAVSLPARVRSGNEERYQRVLEALGGRPSSRMKKLAVFLVDHTKE